MKETTFYIYMFALCIVSTLASFTTGKSIGRENATKDFVAQCQKSQFYFADGVGIQCPAVVDNRVTKGEQ